LCARNEFVAGADAQSVDFGSRQIRDLYPTASSIELAHAVDPCLAHPCITDRAFRKRCSEAISAQIRETVNTPRRDIGYSGARHGRIEFLERSCAVANLPIV
jgi:hypothetical protein